MSLFPRAFTSEFTPLFRLLDDYASHSAATSNRALNAARTFQPRFDIKETKDSYELHGELPGVQRDGLSIEFTDQHTLSIKGRTESYREEGSRPGQIEAASEGSTPAAIEGGDSATANATAEHYHKPTVEDEEGASNTTTTVAQTSSNNNQEVTKTEGQQQQQPQSRYWLSERSIGTFARTFQFPSRVDQDNVKASLANGILSIVVPKATAPQARKIAVQ